MIEFLNMDGYGIFIWPSYIFSFSLISYLYFRSVKQLKKLEKEVEAIENKKATEKFNTAESFLRQTA